MPKQRPQSEKIDVEQHLMLRTHRGHENDRGGVRLMLTYTRTNIGAESEPETRIENSVEKTVQHHPRREIHIIAQDNGTGSEG